MNFDLSPTEFDLIIAVTDLTKEAAYPAKPNAHAGVKAVRKRLLDVAAMLAGTQYLSAGLVPETDAGVKMMAAMEAFAGADADAFFPLEMSTRVVGRLLSRYGNTEQQETFLQPLLKGRAITALALCEKTMNVVNDPLTSTGTPDGEQVLVTAEKQYVVNAPVADWIAVVGLFQEVPAVFMIPRKTEGMSYGNPLRIPGKRFLPMASVSADNCRIPQKNVICMKHPGDLLQRLRCWENQVCMAESVGLMKTALESAKAHAKSHATGEKPIIAYQEVAFKLAEMLTMVQTAELMSYKAAWMESVGDKEAATFNDCAKVFCTESAETVSSGALSILSGNGFFQDNPVENAWHSSKFCQIAGTSTEIARVQIGDATR